MIASDRHGEWDECDRCGYRAQISRSAAFGGFLAVIDGADGSVICWDGRECMLRYKRKQRAALRTGT